MPDKFSWLDNIQARPGPGCVVAVVPVLVFSFVMFMLGLRQTILWIAGVVL